MTKQIFGPSLIFENSVAPPQQPGAVAAGALQFPQTITRAEAERRTPVGPRPPRAQERSRQSAVGGALNSRLSLRPAAGSAVFEGAHGQIFDPRDAFGCDARTRALR